MGKHASLPGRFQGAVPAHHILLWICNETWNDLALPILRGLEALGDRGRRPHVPSSKPTMSKSRASPSRVCPGRLLAVERDANGVGQKPCPVGERPYMEDTSYRQWPFSELFRRGGSFPEKPGERSRIRVPPDDRDRVAKPPFQDRSHQNFKENNDLPRKSSSLGTALWSPWRAPSRAFLAAMLNGPLTPLL